MKFAQRVHTAILVVTVPAAAMVFSLQAWRALDFQTPVWAIGADFWVSVEAAHYVGWGAYGYIYESHKDFIVIPLLALILAPAAMLNDRLHLSESRSIILVRPAAWLLYGPYVTVLAVAALAVGTGRLVAGVNARARAWAAQLAVVVVVFVPCVVVFGHPEDVLAFSALLGAEHARQRDGWTRMAVLIGTAIAAKQWAILAVPVLLAATPASRRRGVIVRAVALPASLLALPLLLDPGVALHHLMHPSTYPPVGHPAPWIDPRRIVIQPELIRGISFVTAGLAGWWVRRGSATPAAVAGALALALGCRALTEGVLFPYYVSPALGLVAIAEFYRDRPRPVILALCVLTLAWFVVPAPRPPWWIGFYGMFGGLLAVAALPCRSGLGDPGLTADVRVPIE